MQTSLGIFIGILDDLLLWENRRIQKNTFFLRIQFGLKYLVIFFYFFGLSLLLPKFIGMQLILALKIINTAECNAPVQLFVRYNFFHSEGV